MEVNFKGLICRKFEAYTHHIVLLRATAKSSIASMHSPERAEPGGRGRPTVKFPRGSMHRIEVQLDRIIYFSIDVRAMDPSARERKSAVIYKSADDLCPRVICVRLPEKVSDQNDIDRKVLHLQISLSYCY